MSEDQEPLLNASGVARFVAGKHRDDKPVGEERSKITIRKGEKPKVEKDKTEDLKPPTDKK